MEIDAAELLHEYSINLIGMCVFKYKFFDYGIQLLSIEVSPSVLLKIEVKMKVLKYCHQTTGKVIVK
jgi:hypothetical protein